MANLICRGKTYYLQWPVGGKIKRRSLRTSVRTMKRPPKRGQGLLFKAIDRLPEFSVDAVGQACDECEP